MSFKSRGKTLMVGMEDVSYVQGGANRYVDSLFKARCALGHDVALLRMGDGSVNATREDGTLRRMVAFRIAARASGDVDVVQGHFTVYTLLLKSGVPSSKFMMFFHG